MIEVKNLTKRYGDIKALDDISFTVDTGLPRALLRLTVPKSSKTRAKQRAKSDIFPKSLRSIPR